MYIVLDIDATLVHTHGDMNKFRNLEIYKDKERLELRRKLYSLEIVDVSSDAGTGELTELSGIYRPYLKEFLYFCFNYFDGVIVWSAGKKKYVEKMCEFMFPLKEKPEIIYSYNDCESDENDLIVKPLVKLYKDERLKGKLNEKNTIVLDDRPDTFSFNKRNGIAIPVFESDMSVEDISTHSDDNLLKLVCWLKLLEKEEVKDIRKVN